MAARPFGMSDVAPAARRTGQPPAHLAFRRLFRHKMVVVAPRMADVVRDAGGWLVDSVLAGAEALVLTADHTNDQPARILGARAAFDLDCALNSVLHTPLPNTIAVHAGLYATDARLRRLVREATDGDLAEVTFWGADLPVAQSYRLSSAARAFKARALAVVAAPADAVDAVELFHHGALTPAD